jgi:hypothetical protein
MEILGAIGSLASDAAYPAECNTPRNPAEVKLGLCPLV